MPSAANKPPAPAPPDALETGVALLRQGELAKALQALVEDAALLARKGLPLYSDGLRLTTPARRAKVATACEEVAQRLVRVAQKLREGI